MLLINHLVLNACNLVLHALGKLGLSVLVILIFPWGHRVLPSPVQLDTSVFPSLLSYQGKVMYTGVAKFRFNHYHHDKHSCNP